MKIRNRKIVVTGGAGFIGSNLVKALLAENNHVLIIDDFSQGKVENLKESSSNPNLRVKKATILNEAEMIKLTKETDIIFHMAVQCLRVSLSNPLYVHEVNSTGTLNMLLAAQKNQVKRFIYCSSSEVYGKAINIPMDENHPFRPTTVYGASKLTGEIYTNCFFSNYGIETVIVRPFNTYGFNEHITGKYGEVIPRIITRIKNNLPPIIYGSGDQTRDFTFVTDTVNGIILAAGEDKLVGDTVNIARGVEVKITTIAEIIMKYLGKNFKLEFQEARPHDVSRHIANIEKAKKLLNFQSQIDIEEGIKIYIDYLEKSNVDFTKLLKEIPERNW